MPDLTSTRFQYQWHLHNTGQGGGAAGADVDVLGAWGVTMGSPAVRVAIIDSGVDDRHPALHPNLAAGYNFDQENQSPFPEDASAKAAHGTACAGIVAAVPVRGGVVGIAPGCRIVPVKLTGRHAPDQCARAIRWSAEHADVLLCAWGADSSRLVAAALNDTVQGGRAGRGMPVLCAALDRTRSSPFPANLPGMLSIGASTNQDRAASYNRGRIDLLAPSSGGTLAIETTDLCGQAGRNRSGDYCRADAPSGFGGTSAAAALAAGVVALMLSANPELTAAEVQTILCRTAAKIEPEAAAYNQNGWSRSCGYGRINAAAAVRHAAEMRNQRQLTMTLEYEPAAFGGHSIGERNHG